MRFLAIDFGEKRVGVAISDASGEIATPLTTLARSNDLELAKAISKIVQAEDVDQVIIGEPRGLDGRRGEAAERVSSFARKLEAVCDRSVEMIDEVLTSVAAIERLREAGVDIRRHPDRIDAVAAQIILEDALAKFRRSS